MKVDSLNITPDILKIISEIDEFSGSWKVMQNISPERLTNLKKVATIESIGSSTRIEGVKLTNAEIEELLSNLDQKSFQTRDEQEIAGYAEVMDLIFLNHTEIRLTENYIKQLHAMLLHYSDKDERHRGQYKTLNNHVEAFDADGKSLGVIFQTTSPFETPLKMQELIYWTRESLEDKSLHPLLVIGIFIVSFLHIHPFQDGNGRLSRVLTTLLLLKSNYTYVPYSSLENIVEQNKEGYYLSLRQTQSTLENDNPHWLPWVRFFLFTLKAQKDQLINKIEREKTLTFLPEESIIIMAQVREKGRITTREAEEITKKPRSTVKKRLGDLVQDGLLVRCGKARGTWYQLP